MNDIETWALGSPRLKATEAKYDGSLVLLYHLRDHQQYKLLQVELDLDTGEEAEGEGGEDEYPGQGGEQPPADPDPVLRVIRWGGSA